MWDVIVVGAGPAGLSAALLLGRARRRVLVIDSGEPRNKVARSVNGFLGADGVSPHELRARGREQCRAFGVGFVDGRVIDVRSHPVEAGWPTCFEVQTADGQTRECRKLLFATGVRDTLPDIPGLVECYGITVHHCPYCDGWEHRDRVLAAVGKSAAAAMKLATTLLGWSGMVLVLSNGDALDESERTRAEATGLRILDEPIQSIVHEQGHLREVVFDDGTTTNVDALFFSTGQTRPCELPERLGCHIGKNDRVGTTDKQGTCVTGVFLAGDADGDTQFAIVAAAEGATAAVALNDEILKENADQLAKASSL